MASVIASYIARVSAFFFSGRAIWMVATPPAMLALMVIADGWSGSAAPSPI
jgi:hypothetical protein